MSDPQLTVDPETTTSPSAPAAFTASSRRRLLQRVGVASLAGGGALALAACGGEDSGSATPSTSAPAGGASSASSPSAASSSPASSPSASASSPAAKAPAGVKVAKADVKVGGGVILADDKLVVTQPEAGTFKAFDAVCTHQGCLVNQISGTDIDCPCHGSKFSIADGSVTNGPAQQALAGKKVTVSGSDLYVS